MSSEPWLIHHHPAELAENGEHRISLSATFGDDHFYLGIELPPETDEALRVEIAGRLQEHLNTTARTTDEAVVKNLPRIYGLEKMKFVKMSPGNSTETMRLAGEISDLRTRHERRHRDARRRTIYAPKVQSNYQRKLLADSGMKIDASGIIDPRQSAK